MIRDKLFSLIAWMLVAGGAIGLSSRMAFAAEAGADWQEVQSEHFVIRHQHVPLSFVNEVLREAETHYRHTMTTLGFTRYKGWSWSSRVKISIYHSREDYVGSSHHAWSGGQVNLATREIVTFPSERGFFDTLLPHELGHIIFREAAGSHGNIPLWLDEGVAMFQERAQSIEADADVRELIARDAYIPLAELNSMALRSTTDRAVVGVFYREAASLVRFLIVKYEVYRFERLCRELKKGREFTAALKSSYMEFENLAALEKAWRRYLDETHW
ncbi:MAG: hypothetical protein V2A70_01175 [Candidatus Omnitrophota bacterium]